MPLTWTPGGGAVVLAAWAAVAAPAESSSRAATASTIRFICLSLSHETPQYDETQCITCAPDRTHFTRYLPALRAIPASSRSFPDLIPCPEYSCAECGSSR